MVVVWASYLFFIVSHWSRVLILRLSVHAGHMVERRRNDGVTWQASLDLRKAPALAVSLRVCCQSRWRFSFAHEEDLN